MSLRNGGKAKARATTAAGHAKALGRRFAGYGAGGGSLVVVVTDGVAGAAAKWSRDTTFLGSAMSTTVHRCLVCCVDGSEGR